MRCMKKTMAQREAEYDTQPAPKKNKTPQKGTLQVYDSNSGKTETLQVNSVRVSDAEHQRIGQKMVELAQAKQGYAQAKQETAQARQEIAQARQETAQARQEVINARQGIVIADQKIVAGQQKKAEGQQKKAEGQQKKAEGQQKKAEGQQKIVEAKMGQQEATARIEKANQASTEIVKKMLLTQTADQIAHDPRMAKLDSAVAQNLIAMAKELEAKSNM
jgi:hypothetical protein